MAKYCTRLSRCTLFCCTLFWLMESRVYKTNRMKPTTDQIGAGMATYPILNQRPHPRIYLLLYHLGKKSYCGFYSNGVTAI
jgi:hypothetical protein